MHKFKIQATPETPAPASIAAFGSAAPFAGGSRGDKPIRLNLDLSPEMHRQLKRTALDAGESVSGVVRGLIERHLRG